MSEAHYLQRCESADGYPNLAFEHWYQFGMQCHMARLTPTLRRQALVACVKLWKDKGKRARAGGVSPTVTTAVEFWMLRAFAYGASGRDSEGKRRPYVSSDFAWPQPPDAAWQLVVCCYPDGECDLDMVHPVSRRFWTDDHPYFDPPGPSTRFDRRWYESMGFDTMIMFTTAAFASGAPTRHLSLVRA